MLKLINGVLKFHEEALPARREEFAALALGQQPDAFMWACIDSRVVPNLFASTHPGDLLVQRNPGNIIPPYHTKKASGTKAALSLGMRKFPIQDLIVCGHLNCGAMATLLDWDHTPSDERQWLQFAHSAKTLVEAGIHLDSHLSPVDQLSQVNVVVQMLNLQTYPQVAEAMTQGALRVHGWWFDISTGEVKSYEPAEQKFVTIGPSTRQQILDRMDRGESALSAQDNERWYRLIHDHSSCGERWRQGFVHRASRVMAKTRSLGLRLLRR